MTFEEDKPKEKVIGECTCELCGTTGELILRERKQFKVWFCNCPSGHKTTIKKEIDDIFQVGDRIRTYHVPFFSPIDYTSYEEGVVVAKQKSIINYELDMKIDKAVMNGKSVIKTSWLYGYIVKGIGSDSDSLELLTPQMKLEI